MIYRTVAHMGIMKKNNKDAAEIEWFTNHFKWNLISTSNHFKPLSVEFRNLVNIDMHRKAELEQKRLRLRQMREEWEIQQQQQTTV